MPRLTTAALVALSWVPLSIAYPLQAASIDKLAEKPPKALLQSTRSVEAFEECATIGLLKTSGFQPMTVRNASEVTIVGTFLGSIYMMVKAKRSETGIQIRYWGKKNVHLRMVEQCAAAS